MNALERLSIYPGFVYQLGQDFYYLGKWICKPCTELEVTDCHAMYGICSAAGERSNASLYFQKLRAYSDFALDVPYNQAKIHENLAALLAKLSLDSQIVLENQLDRVAQDFEDFCGPLMN